MRFFVNGKLEIRVFPMEHFNRPPRGHRNFPFSIVNFQFVKNLNKKLTFPILTPDCMRAILTVLIQLIQLKEGDHAASGLPGFQTHLHPDHRRSAPADHRRVLEPGDKLPSVRELASELAINPNTIQRSYRQLEMEGWIVTVPGKGCFVCAAPSLRDREVERLLTIFDTAAAQLENLGLSREELAARLRKEDKVL